MILKGILFITGIIVIGVLFLINNAMSKPLYNKMHNVWEEDPEGKKYANITLLVMLFIAFFIGTIF
jgi:uncharacterized membrane protein SpoIIM required for sporulation